MNVELLDSQYEFLTHPESVSFFIGGIGVGKSYILAHVILKHIVEFPDSNILLVANTYQQIVSATVPALIGVLDEAGIEYKLSMSGAKKRVEVRNVTVFIYSLEKHDNIRGIEVGLLAGDEIAYSSIDAFNVIIGRLRCKHGSLQARFVSSPNGFNWVYDIVQKDNIGLVRARTKDNKFLPEQYIKQLEDLYGKDSKLYKQECDGEFVSISEDSVYYAFNRETHVKPTAYNPMYPVYVGQDFNIGNMNSVFIQHYDDKLHVISEKTLEGEGANTFDAGLMLNDVYPEANKKLVCDSTGNARKTSAKHGRTDHQILRDMGLNLVSFSNPRIKDRWNTVNRLFFLDKVQIDPSCKSLINEFETLTNKSKEGDVAHLSVAFGYAAWKLAPIKKPQLKTTKISNPFIG